MPLLIVSYGLQYLDKLALSYGAIMGLRTDLVRVPPAGHLWSSADHVSSPLKTKSTAGQPVYSSLAT
jgi:hypothetical protein